MKEVVKDRAPISMDALVQQTESSFTAGVLHFPLPAKFRMSSIEAFDGTKTTSTPTRLGWSCMDTRTSCDIEPLSSR